MSSHRVRRRHLATARHRTPLRHESRLVPIAAPTPALTPPAMERPSRTPAPRHRRLPSSIDMPTMRRPPSAPPPREGSRPLLSPLQSAARALLPCAVYAWPPHASRLGAQKDGLGAAVTTRPNIVTSAFPTKLQKFSHLYHRRSGTLRSLASLIKVQSLFLRE